MTDLKQFSRSWKSGLEWQWRLATWRRRALPDFIIIGAQKSGTSSLFSYLSQHPQLRPSSTKEVHFFDGGTDPDIDTYKKGQAWYRAHFPISQPTIFKTAVFEASPLYIFNPLAPQRISSLIPKIKLIVVLRSPTERAISHYFHERRRGRETRPIREALQQEDASLASAISSNDFKSDAFIHQSYKHRGLYRQQIERFLACFPRSQLMIVDFNNLANNPKKTVAQVCDFVDVDPDFEISNFTPRNVSNNRSDIEPEIYSVLDEFFAPHNDDLEKLTGMHFGW